VDDGGGEDGVEGEVRGSVHLGQLFRSELRLKSGTGGAFGLLSDRLRRNKVAGDRVEPH